MDAEGRTGARDGVADCGQDDTPPGQADPELLARADQPAVERAARTSEAAGGLVEGEALEVAEDQWQPRGRGQRDRFRAWSASACSRSMAPAGRPAGPSARSRRTRPKQGPLIAWSSSRRRWRTTCCAQRKRPSGWRFVEPVAQQVGVADQIGRTRPGLEHRPEGVHGDLRASPRKLSVISSTIGQRRSFQRCRRRPRREEAANSSARSLAVGQPGGLTALKEQPSRPEDEEVAATCAICPLSVVRCPLSVVRCPLFADAIRHGPRVTRSLTTDNGRRTTDKRTFLPTPVTFPPAADLSQVDKKCPQRVVVQ